MPVFWVVLAMSVAMIFYFCSLLIAKNHRATHIILALAGFALDLAATALMEMKFLQHEYIGFGFAPFALKLHVISASAALLFFIVQMAFGMLRMKTIHVFCATYVFMPVWIISFLSGIYLFF